MNQKAAFSFIICILIVGCTNQVQHPHPSITSQPTVTLFPSITPVATISPRPTNTLTATPIPSPTPTIDVWPTWDTSYNLFTFREITPVETISLETARSFIGIRIPPLPDGVTQEFVRFFPDGGEMPSSTLYYQIFVMRLGNARMLWLGVPFAETTSDSESRIYDAILLPPVQEGDILIPFTSCSNKQSDYLLTVIASRPKDGDYFATDIHYAWKIDPINTTLQPVYYQDIECLYPI